MNTARQKYIEAYRAFRVTEHARSRYIPDLSHDSEYNLLNRISYAPYVNMAFDSFYQAKNTTDPLVSRQNRCYEIEGNPKTSSAYELMRIAAHWNASIVRQTHSAVIFSILNRPQWFNANYVTIRRSLPR